MKPLMKAEDRLFVALDVETPEQALGLVRTLRGHTNSFKIGSKLFTAAGPGLVREIVSQGARVFLDLKFHDIPTVVAAAAAEAARLGVFLFTVHAAGGREMMRQAAAAAAEAADRNRHRRPLVVGVTVLTSADQTSLEEIGVKRSLRDQVLGLARLSAESGLDGVVASPLEVQLIRTSITSSDFLIVTPGVRPAPPKVSDDQRRVTSPGEAIKAGASYLVVGRPILDASDPTQATREIVQQIELGLNALAEPHK